MVIVTSVVARVAANVIGGASFALGYLLMEKAAKMREAQKKKPNSFWDKVKSKLTTTRR